MLPLKNVRTSHIRIKMVNRANVNRKTLKGVKSGDGSLTSPSQVKVVLLHVGYLLAVSSRCHATCRRSDGRGQSIDLSCIMYTAFLIINNCEKTRKYVNNVKRKTCRPHRKYHCCFDLFLKLKTPQPAEYS